MQVGALCHGAWVKRPSAQEWKPTARSEQAEGSLDWNWDEDRCTLRTGHGPENLTRLRRFATGLIKSKSRDSVAATIAKLARNVRRVCDYLRMTDNAILRPRPPCHQAS